MNIVGATSALVNNSKQVVLIAPPDSRRVIAFQTSLQQINWPVAKVISYQQVIDQPDLLQQQIRQGNVVRLETAGESCTSERLLLELGKTTNNAVKNITDLQLEQGEIIPSIQWYAGLKKFYKHLKKQLGNCEKHYCTIDLDEGLQLFDKRITSQKWQEASLPVPVSVTEPIASFEQLIAVLKKHRLSRVFIKLAHGSGASGAIALAFNNQKVQAITTIEMVESNGQWRFYNSRKLIRYNSWQTIETLINQLLTQHHLQIEAWIPKATYQGKVFDIRVVVIGGKAMHTLIRLGKQAMTNLHLGNGRGDLEQIRKYLGDTWELIPELAEQAMQSFPHSLYAGVDVLLAQNFKKAYLLEANTFGDFHPNTYYQGLDTYQAELAMLLKRHNLGSLND